MTLGSCQADSDLGGFSGVVHITIPEDPYQGAPASNPRRGAGSPGPRYGGRPKRTYRPPDDQNSGCNGGTNQWGDRSGDAVNWHDHNPTDLVSNLRGAKVYVASGNGTPCGPEDPRPRVVSSMARSMVRRGADTAAAAG